MGYSKTTWENGTTPALNDIALNKIENGIEQTNCKYILATVTNQQNLGSYSKINLNSVIANVGNKFTLQNNKITIGEGVSRIRVSGAIFVEAPQNTGYVWGQISLSNYRISGCIFPYNNGGGFLSVSIPPTIISCQQGDEIELIGDSTVQGNTRTGKDSTWILVEAIDY